MKRILNKPIRDEKGQALILALILLVIGGLIIGPLLGYMSTGLITGQVYEERMDELYAADAGVEDAIWQIKTKAAELPQAGDDPPTWEYSIAEDDPVNDKDVSVTIEYVDDVTFKITSTATTENDPTTTDDDSSTTIESYINILDFTLFTDNAITSMGTVDLKSEGEKKAMVYDGDVVYCTGDAPSEEQVIGGDVRNECLQDYWPTAGQLSAFYWEDLQDNAPYTVYDQTTLDLKDWPATMGPFYRDGDLDIVNSANNEGLTLEGTVYVTGDLVFKQPGVPKAYTVDLNGQTIFAEGSITFPPQGVTLTGNGCIIAVGNVVFHPQMASDEDDFVFVMSVDGFVDFSPGGNFYGSLAGNVEVQLQPGNTLNWVEPPDDLNLPGFSDKNVITAIRTWEIILQQE